MSEEDRDRKGRILAQLRLRRERLSEALYDTTLLFCDPETGRFRPGAVEWMERIARRNFVRDTTFVSGDPEQTLINEGRRQAAQEMFDQILLAGEKFDDVNAQIREIEDGRR